MYELGIRMKIINKINKDWKLKNHYEGPFLSSNF